jgi:acetyltransferase
VNAPKAAVARDAPRTRDGIAYRIRPIRGDDAEREREFIVSLSDESRHNRFMCALREPSEAMIESFVHVDRERTMALVAVVGDAHHEQIIGVARYAVTNDAAGECEFAVTVADEWQGRGIGTTLARALFDYAKARGFRRLYGTILVSNARMQDLARYLGLKPRSMPGSPGVLEAYICLDSNGRGAHE